MLLTSPMQTEAISIESCVAIEKATRTIYYRVYSKKTGTNTTDFLDECIEFFPMLISHVLTDNGIEFIDRLLTEKRTFYLIVGTLHYFYGG